MVTIIYFFYVKVIPFTLLYHSNVSKAAEKSRFLGTTAAIKEKKKEDQEEEEDVREKPERKQHLLRILPRLLAISEAPIVLFSITPRLRDFFFYEPEKIKALSKQRSRAADD